MNYFTLQGVKIGPSVCALQQLETDLVVHAFQWAMIERVTM